MNDHRCRRHNLEHLNAQVDAALNLLAFQMLFHILNIYIAEFLVAFSQSVLLFCKILINAYKNKFTILFTKLTNFFQVNLLA
jgi:hypothetical protein